MGDYQYTFSPAVKTETTYSDQESVLAICYSANYFGSLSCKMFIQLPWNQVSHFSQSLPNILFHLSHHKCLADNTVVLIFWLCCSCGIHCGLLSPALVVPRLQLVSTVVRLFRWSKHMRTLFAWKSVFLAIFSYMASE